ncbi:MAG: sulfurtransferase TusA family protein [Hydrogenobaculum sp.]|jgi:tRNA 2-thiouridine synthesizing protein A
MAIKADRTLDASGLNCPLPVLKTKKEMAEMSSGQILELITTDPGAKADIPAYCKRTGDELLETVEEGGKIIFYIKKK